MKKYLVKIFLLIILFLLIIYIPYSNAADINLNITSDEFIEEFNPNSEMSDEVNVIAKPIATSMMEIVRIALGVIQVIGGILAVISITIFGLNMILATHKPLANDLGFGRTPDDLKALVDFGRTTLIGATLLLAGGTIVKLILNVLIT